MPVYGKELEAEHRLYPPIRANPFCRTCGYRMMPQWGEHVCDHRSLDIKRTRQLAGHLISNLHYYRAPPGVQIAALVEALAWTLGAYVHPSRVNADYWSKLRRVTMKIIRTMQGRIRRGVTAGNLVMEVHRPRLQAKKRKAKR